MVQFLSIIFFSWISSIFVGFFKSSRFFCVILYYIISIEHCPNSGTTSTEFIFHHLPQFLEEHVLVPYNSTWLLIPSVFPIICLVSCQYKTPCIKYMSIRIQRLQFSMNFSFHFVDTCLEIM